MTPSPILVDEAAAKAWLTDELGVSRETMNQLEALAAFVRSEAERQNLVARSTLDSLWQRHIIDSAQLLRFAPATAEHHWLDLGTGAGFPGLVIAILAPCRMTLVESRGLRIDYLQRAVTMLGLDDRVTVDGRRLELVESFAANRISARAFAPLDKLLMLAGRFSTENTVWVLPKGQSGRKELESLPALWQTVFHVEHSLTDAEAAIIVGRGKIEVASSKPAAKSALRQSTPGKRKQFRRFGSRQ